MSTWNTFLRRSRATPEQTSPTSAGLFVFLRLKGAENVTDGGVKVEVPSPFLPHGGLTPGLCAFPFHRDIVVGVEAVLALARSG